ncbi:triose-phosphate isomerase [Marinobacter fuscus]|uniref:Triosephosphate isomerase n=1 Tax=Marinobacter fuscus TaxID=2109942 RepID=A0A2T1KEJ5_9GAMM|nr:triose-phosphate isomerase [Marinobacter fuscus]PSF08183.1 triose-phosphate isomerase [Marinobacter fuscus]
MRRKIVAGNWKMHGSKGLVRDLVGAISGQVGSGSLDVVIFPPAPYVSYVAKMSGGAVRLGLQNVSEHDAGAYTGEVSASMARDVGCDFVLVGHSERRQMFAETDDLVARKVEKVIASGMTAVLCVGEVESERESGEAEAVVERQVRQGLADVPTDRWGSVVVAYEPVWAIGTGKTATAEDAQAMHAAIRRVLSEMGAPANSISVLYGGSVKADNAAALFAGPDVDGGLVGGASLNAEEFLSICRCLSAGA